MVETFKNRHSPMLALVVLLSVLLSLSIRCAYAEEIGGGGGSHNIGGSYPVWGTVWYGPSQTSNVVGTKYYQYGVVANTKYDAAIYNLGLNTGTYGEKLTNKKKAKLIANTSAFTTFADIFKVGKPDLDPSLIFNTDYAVVSAWDSARQMYGETYCFSAMYTLDQKQAALNYAKSVLDAPDTPAGGGDASTPSSGLVVKQNMYWTGNYTAVLGETSYIEIADGVVDSIKNYATSYNAPYVIYSAYNTGTRSSYVGVFVCDVPIKIRKVGGVAKGFSFSSKPTVLRMKVCTGTVKKDDNDKYYINLTSFSGSNLSYVRDVSGSGTNWRYDTKDYYYSDYGTEAPDGGEDDPEPPPTWPTEPTKPTGGSPDVPGPGDDPTIPLPPEDPTPTPPTPWDPIPDIGIEITGEDFQDLIDALDEHCKHLQQSITSNIGQLWDLQSSYFDSQFSDLVTVIKGNLQWLGNDVIVACFSDLKTYLQELFEWLSDRMDFDINVTNGQYDDTSVIYWLKQIWAALGSGINTEPVDPVTQGDDWWAWLLALMGNFVAMLLAFGADKLGDVTSAVQTLAGKFPFCLPWDLAAMFALLDATPVIPAFDLPCFALTSGGLSEVGQYHITLEAFDGVWEGIRWVERLGFVVMLIRYTDKLMAVMRRAVGR